MFVNVRQRRGGYEEQDYLRSNESARERLLRI